MILGLRIQKAQNKYNCVECNEEIPLESKYAYRETRTHGINTTKCYCSKCAKTLLRKLMIQLHEDKVIE